MAGAVPHHTAPALGALLDTWGNPGEVAFRFAQGVPRRLLSGDLRLWWPLIGCRMRYRRNLHKEAKANVEKSTDRAAAGNISELMDTVEKLQSELREALIESASLKAEKAQAEKIATLTTERDTKAAYHDGVMYGLKMMGFGPGVAPGSAELGGGAGPSRT